MSQNKITKSDLVDSIFSEKKIEKKIIQDVIDSLLGQLKNSLIDGSTIELRGFGTFELRERKGRAKARNPRTGDVVSVEPHSIVAFRSGKELKSAVWNAKLYNNTDK